MSNQNDFVVFSNAGEIDIAAVTTLGVSVKLNPGAIGYFGTGLKYSIAVLLREGCEIIIFSGLMEYVFYLKKQRIRGEDFEIVHMAQRKAGHELAEHPVSLQFTTGFGRNWTLENVYRELHSNMQDERGQVELWPYDTDTVPMKGRTQIIIRGNAFADVHERRYNFLLSPRRTKLAETANGKLQIYAGQSEHVFYRGIAAHKLAKSSRLTYNITGDHPLTEDRTLLHGTYFLDQMIKNWITGEAEEEHVTDAITTDGDVFHEGSMHYSTLGGAGENFKRAAKAAMEKLPEHLNSSAIDLFCAVEKHAKLDYTPRELSSAEQQTLDAALERIAEWGFSYAQHKFRVTVVDFAGRNVIARVNQNVECILTHAALDDLDLLEHALIEEFIHMRDDVHDHTAAMQNSLFREIVRLGRKSQQVEEIVIQAEPAPFVLGESAMDDEIPF